MSLSLLVKRRKELDVYERCLPNVKRRIVELQNEIKKLESPSSLSDDEATKILTQFLEKVRSESDLGLLEARGDIKYYTLNLKDMPDKFNWAGEYFVVRKESIIEPNEEVRDALNHFRINWEIGSGISHYWCAM